MNRGKRRLQKRGREGGTSILSSVDELLLTRPVYEIDQVPAMEGDEDRVCIATDRFSPNGLAPAPISAHPEKWQRIEKQPSEMASPTSPPSLLFESYESSEGLGLGAELALLNRREEETAEMALFLSSSLVKVPSLGNLCELAEHLGEHGVDSVLASLKHLGSIDCFFSHLFSLHVEGLRSGDKSVHQQEDPSHMVDEAFLRILCVLVDHADLEVLCRQSVVEALLQRVTNKTANRGGDVEPMTGTSPTEQRDGSTKEVQRVQRRRHWADVGQKKTSPKITARSVSATDGDMEMGVRRLRKAVTALETCDTASSHTHGCFSLALHMLLQLVLRQNQQGGELPEGTCVVKLFARLGGLSVLADRIDDLVAEPTTEALGKIDSILSFLEVLTASNRLSNSEGLCKLAAALTRVLSREFASCEPTMSPCASERGRTSSTRRPITHISGKVLRVMTNVTGIASEALTTLDRTQLGRVLRTVLSSSAAGNTETDNEDEIFSLCCAVNVVKWETKAGHSECTTALVHDIDESVDTSDSCRCNTFPLLNLLAAAMMTSYKIGETDEMVRSGYYALFLGVVSLAPSAERDDKSMRVPVLTAVAEATRGTTWERASGGTPMSIVVAIIQEFLLFQSASGTLTRDALIEMKEIVDALVQANCLAISS